MATILYATGAVGFFCCIWLLVTSKNPYERAFWGAILLAYVVCIVTVVYAIVTDLL